jgi:hypothetical protein
MADAVITILRRLPLLLVFLAFPHAVLAHRLDEYLQATLVAIEPEGIRLQINLTPGVAVADKVLALIDSNRDGIISTNEAAAYAELIKRDLTVQLDQHDVGMNLTASYFPDSADLRTGLGIIQMEFSVTASTLSAGAHKLTVLNRHLPALSVYLINAALPRSASVQISAQKRNENQSLGEIEFNLDRPANSSKEFGIVASLIALPLAVFAVVATRKSLKRG